MEITKFMHLEKKHNNIISFNGNRFVSKQKEGFIPGMNYEGRLVEQTNKNAKKYNKWFSEIYNFKKLSSMKHFRQALKVFE